MKIIRQVLKKTLLLLCKSAKRLTCTRGVMLSCALPLKSQTSVLRDIAFSCSLGFVVSTAHASELKATIVEENGGAIGKINWVVLSERNFSPVLEGEGSSIRARLDPGLYIVSVDGDTQGRTSVKIDTGIKSIKINTRKFY